MALEKECILRPNLGTAADVPEVPYIYRNDKVGAYDENREERNFWIDYNGCTKKSFTKKLTCDHKENCQKIFLLSKIHDRPFDSQEKTCW